MHKVQTQSSTYKTRTRILQFNPTREHVQISACVIFLLTSLPTWCCHFQLRRSRGGHCVHIIITYGTRLATSGIRKFMKICTSSTMDNINKPTFGNIQQCDISLPYGQGWLVGILRRESHIIWSQRNFVVSNVIWCWKTPCDKDYLRTGIKYL